MIYKLFLISLIFILVIPACKDDDQSPTDSFNELCCKVPPLEECIQGAKFFVPNAFTPNGDGFNDVFRVFVGGGILQVVSFKITDQDGQLLFQLFNFNPQSQSDSWDGRINGELKEGLFNYEIIISTITNVTQTFTGQVCSRISLPLVCLENNRDDFCIFGNLHDGNGGMNYNIDSGENCP